MSAIRMPKAFIRLSDLAEFSLNEDQQTYSMTSAKRQLPEMGIQALSLECMRDLTGLGGFKEAPEPTSEGLVEESPKTKTPEDYGLLVGQLAQSIPEEFYGRPETCVSEALALLLYRYYSVMAERSFEALEKIRQDHEKQD